jgi:hypothetical protein
MKWKKKKMFTVKVNMQCVIVPALNAAVRDILKTKKYALFVQVRVARTKSTVNRQAAWVAKQSLNTH